MVAEVPTEAEKAIVTELVTKARALVPNVKLRFVRRVQESGEKGLLLGVQLPPELPVNSIKVFSLQDLCEAQGRECNLSIGLTVSQPAGSNEVIDLAFLPGDVKASATALGSTYGGMLKPRPLAITAAVIVVLIIVGLMAQKQQSGHEIRETSTVVPVEKVGGTHRSSTGNGSLPSTTRQQALDDLEKYSNVLRASGRSTEAEQVQRIMRELP